MIENRKERYASRLWEFWKSDVELFPPEIVSEKRGLDTKPHAVILVFDGSIEDILDTEEEIAFYRKTVSSCRSRGYSHPFIVLTKIDLFEARMRKKLMKEKLTDKEIDMRLVKAKDGLIDGIANKLKVHRNYIDFIENYTDEESTHNLMIDYYALVTLDKIITECLSYIEQQTKSFCQIF